MKKIVVTGGSGGAGWAVIRELLAEYYPTVPIREPLEDTASLFSIKKARELLGYQPQYSWRDQD